MKTLLALLPALLLFSCGPGKPERLPNFPIPKAKPVKEVVDTIQRPLDDASQSATKLGEQIRAAKDQADRANQAAEDAEAMAKRYAATLETNKAEWAKIVESIGTIKKENLLLKAKHDQLASTNDGLMQQLGELRQRNTELIASAAETDQKVDLYEQQMRAAGEELGELRKLRDTLQDDLATARSRQKLYRNWLMVLGLIAAAYLAARLLLSRV